MSAEVSVRKNFLRAPSLSLIESIYAQNEYTTYYAFNTDDVISESNNQLLPSRKPTEFVSLHLVGAFTLPNNRYVNIVRALSCNIVFPALERKIYDHLSLRFTPRCDAMTLWQKLREAKLIKRLEYVTRGIRTAVLFPDTKVEDPSWLEIDLRAQMVAPVRMDGIDTGYNDNLYLMSCVDTFDDFEPKTHWFSKRTKPPHILCEDFSTKT